MSKTPEKSKTQKDDALVYDIPPPLCFHLRGLAVTPLAPSRSPAPAADLPPTLLIPPGKYRFRGKDYDVAEEGLYRFLFPSKESQQRIVYRSDRVALLSALSWLHSHGYRENSREYEDVMAQALTGKLIMTCLSFSIFTVKFLSGLGIKARSVSTYALYQNDYDCGHCLTEVALDNRWVLVDIDQHVMFQDQGRRLSLLELCPLLQKDDYQMEYLARSVPLAIGNFVHPVNNHDYALWLETVIHSEATHRRWYRHVLAVPVIEGCYTMPTDAERERVEKVWPDSGLTFLSPSDFERRFYSAETLR